MKLSRIDVLDYQLPDVFDEEEEDEFESDRSPRLSPRSRRDSGIGEMQRRQWKGNFIAIIANLVDFSTFFCN